ncbi:hypothetical protein [Streptomyces sp. MN13]
MPEQNPDLTSQQSVQTSQEIYDRIVSGQAGDVTAELNAAHGREG